MRNPFSIRGCTSRTEYFFTIILYFAYLSFFLIRYSTELNQSPIDYNGVYLASAILFVLLIFLTAASIRRIHDIGYSGWWQIFVCLAPILVIPLIFIKGSESCIEYGPKANGKTLIMLNKVFRVLAAICICIIGTTIISLIVSFICFYLLEIRNFWTYIAFSLFFPIGASVGFLTRFALKTIPIRWIGFLPVPIAFIELTFTGYKLWSGIPNFNIGTIFRHVLITLMIAGVIMATILGTLNQVEELREAKCKSN